MNVGILGSGDVGQALGRGFLALGHQVVVGNPLMFRPELPGGPPSMFICGDDATAKKRVGEICRDFGWEAVDVGPMNAAYYLEAMCMVWVYAAVTSGNWTQAFKLLRK